jgi:hypothetical protein
MKYTTLYFQVAVKVLHTLTKNERARAQSFMAELTTLRLKHPNIVQVFYPHSFIHIIKKQNLEKYLSYN